MDLSGQPMVALASGAAQRRKLRRLRAALRHEQQSIAMALASALHHPADKTTRAQHNAPWGHKAPSTTNFPTKMRCLRGGPGHQTADFAPLVQILDPAEPWEEQSSRSVLRFFLTRWPVGAEQVWNCEGRQVIDVPKISPDQTLQRLGDSLRQPQTAEQLVEVPGFEFVFVRRVEGALSIAVCRAAGHTWAMRVHDTGWSDTAGPGRYTNTGHS